MSNGTPPPPPTPPSIAKRVRLLDDDQGHPSTMRMMSIVGFGVAALLALADAYAWGDTTTSNYDMVLLFLGASFGGKTLQKFAEMQKS